MRAHHVRLKRFIEAMQHKLVCQDCGGAGGWIEPVLDYGQGPWFECGWCEGIGYVTPWVRGLWLRHKECAQDLEISNQKPRSHQG
jgi:hypothetical protein